MNQLMKIFAALLAAASLAACAPATGHDTCLECPVGPALEHPGESGPPAEICLHACNVVNGLCYADDQLDVELDRECAAECPFSDDERACLDKLACGADVSVCLGN